MPGRDLMAWTTIVAGSSEFAAAQIAFSKMPQWSVVSLTALLDHHDDHRSTGNLSLDLFDLFDRMPERNVVSWTAMLGSLARRMDLLAAKRVFDRMPQHTIVSWNAIMAAFALSSSAMTAIVSFQRLILDGLPVNSITFLVLLTACSHLGLVDQSRDYLVAMAMDFGVPLSVDHYSCMVDVLGRSGQLQLATSLLATMPMVPDYVAWCSVVSASKNLHDVESGVFAARSGLELRARDPGLNLLLSNIYFGGLQRISPDLS
ncbi:pentatricopeptide repeat-containing protein At3g29230 [Selaginella moellendorffii]|nr:pentatricopeptide repeat-containing protein At3g29230 [Selaginella moellendorffii]|eukprot:XP_002984043.2 pentatricopeptide repeat-containing protein At3g29230 [Selaginella moellendorffii]